MSTRTHTLFHTRTANELSELKSAVKRWVKRSLAATLPPPPTGGHLVHPVVRKTRRQLFALPIPLGLAFLLFDDRIVDPCNEAYDAEGRCYDSAESGERKKKPRPIVRREIRLLRWSTLFSVLFPDGFCRFISVILIFIIFPQCSLSSMMIVDGFLRTLHTGLLAMTLSSVCDWLGHSRVCMCVCLCFYYFLFL